jgi:multicomponent K+:H+ antiporter subunit D
MNEFIRHLVIVPIVLPLLAAALTLSFDERQRNVRAAISFTTTFILLVVALVLLFAASDSGPHQGAATAYAIGDWAAPFGIVLVADRLSAMMLALTSFLGLSTLLFSLARWDRAGPRFHALFLLLLMGVNGAFLTGDLFNLFVFFEVLLAASYGLVLHGSGLARVKAGLHYVVINLAASSLFLIGVALIYGITGTLNMADLAAKIPAIADADRMLFEIGCAILGIAFLIKAGMWPLGFWLPATYSAASAPAASIFVILTKVGAYVIIRLSLLLFGPEAGASAGFGQQFLVVGGIATIAFGTVGVLASRTMSRVGGYCVIVSAGTILAVVGAGGEAALAGGLYYLISSTLGASAFFLLIELLNRARGSTSAAIPPPIFSDEFRDPYDDGTETDEVGVLIPASVGLISGGYILCALLLAGLPPLSGFVGKFAVMTGVMASEEPVSGVAWTLIGVLTVSSFAMLVAFARTGIEVLWAQGDRPAPKVKPVELLAIGVLLAAALTLSIEGGLAMRFVTSTSAWLHAPMDYVAAVLTPAPALPTGGAP